MSNRTRSGIPDNVAALLSYVLGWITGLIFLLIDKRPFVRFHAAQSVIVFLGLHIARVVVAMIFGVGGLAGLFVWPVSILAAVLFHSISLITLVLWIILMVKAFQGVRFKLPLVGDIAQRLAGQAT
jgi:uncharacterized membrane protein